MSLIVSDFWLPALPFLLLASAQGAGGKPGVQGLDAELEDAWAAEKTVRTKLTLGILEFPLS